MGDDGTDEIKRLFEKLNHFRDAVRDSELFHETVQILPKDIAYIRCLALGSPVHSNASLYQFAYLLELIRHLKIRNTSLYDPVFDDNDEQFFQRFSEEESITIETECTFSSLTVLYFLPHADLSVTNDTIKHGKPRYILGNNLISHTDRMTRQKLHDNYMMLSLLRNLLEPNETETNDMKNENKKNNGNDFIPVRSRRKNHRFIPPKINYTYHDCYFHSIKLTPLKNIKGPWSNAFTDLALHVIS